MEKQNPSALSDALPPGTRIGGYTLARKISEGGMGEVYEGVQRALKRRVAVKLLANWATGRADLRARFLREGETAARIRHHNIVEIYDVGVWGDRPYIVMEYLEGRTLEEVMQLDGALPEDQVVDLMLPVLSAIGAANDRGIIHRDVKPENVFIADMDSGVEPKVLDFGISRVVTSHERNIDSQNLGTPHYMSPEQARGETVDARSDQYSIAIVLYEMVTGHLPRDHEVVTTLMRMVAHEGFVHPREYVASLSDTIVEVVMRALSPDPDDRFDDLQDMMQALVPLASERARNYWERELAVVDDLGRVTERPPPSGSYRATVGGPPESPSAASKELTGEETQAEFLLETTDPGRPAVEPTPKKQKMVWMPVLAAAIVLLAVVIWFSNRRGPAFEADSADSGQRSTSEALTTQAAEANAEPPAPPEPPGTVGEEVQADQEGANIAGENIAGENIEEGSLPEDEPNSAAAPNTWRPLSRADREARRARAARVERAAAAAQPAPSEEPTMDPQPTMTAAMTSPSWEPTGSSDNVDPWN